MLLGTAARLVGWSRVFTPRGVRFVVDTDPNYHVIQAQRLLEQGRAALWFDPWLNWPLGASIPWPPLFDLLIAGSARLAFGVAPTLDQIERAAAVVPVVLGVVTLPLVAGLGRTLLGRGRGAGPALLVALLMSHVSFSTVGRADQHVAEILLSCGVALGFVSGWKATRAGSRWLGALVMGLAVALSFWNWMGSALNLLVPVAFAATCHVLAEGSVSRRVTSALALGLGTATLLLVLSILAWGAPGALGRGALTGITGVHVAATACGAAFGALLLAAGARRTAPPRPARRLLEAALASTVPALLALGLVPALREGVRQGLTALGAANPWYSDVGEFRHLLLSCDLPLREEIVGVTHVYGLGVVAAALAAPALIERWRRGPAERPAVLFLACWAIPYLGLALVRRRFAPYFTIPMALLAWEGLCFAAEVTVRRAWPRRPGLVAALAWLGAALVVAPSIRDLTGPAPRQRESHLDAMRWLGSRHAPESREGVLGPWALGHLILYYARKPVVVSPFGTEGGAGAMELAAQFNLARDPVEAERLLLSRRVGFVVLTNPLAHVLVDQGFAPVGTQALVTRACTVTEGASLSVSDEYATRMAPRLYFFDGQSAPGGGGAPTDGFRLVYETPGAEDPLKVFELVPGALLTVTGALPSRPVSAAVRVRTNQAREFVWNVVAEADRSGSVQLRLPYATGRNGAIEATVWSVGDGGSTAQVATSERDVREGRRIELQLGAVEPRAANARRRGPAR